MNDIIQFLFSRQNLGMKLGLERTYELLEACGNPHNNLPCVQIAGTNGKGSTGAFLDRILREGGYKIGLSTSPHLARVNERLRINGQPISDQYIYDFVRQYKAVIEETGSSFFEILTVLGFQYFKEHDVDLAILETGLGGRLDSVTTCEPFLTLMATISMDHMDILGDSLEKIAFEKAGVLKPGIPCLSVVQDEAAAKVLRDEAISRGTEIVFIDSELAAGQTLGLLGDHQIRNASLAAAATDFLTATPVSRDQISAGLRKCNWYGRNQIIQEKPLIIFDVGHNQDGIKAFLDVFNSLQIRGNKILVMALQSRKKFSSIIPEIENTFNRIICTETENHLKMPAEELAGQFTGKVQVDIVHDPAAAIKLGKSALTEVDALAIAGTHYLGTVINNYFKICFEKL